MENTLRHYGTLGMRWGIRKSHAKLAKEEKKDTKWAHKNYDKIVSKTKRSISKELAQYGNQLLRDPSSATSKGKLSLSTINAYNKKMSELMNTAAKDVAAPSGRAVRFIAKRGEVGVHMALADRHDDLSQFRNGIYGSGRIAYKKKTVNMT